MNKLNKFLAKAHAFVLTRGRSAKDTNARIMRAHYKVKPAQVRITNTFVILEYEQKTLYFERTPSRRKYGLFDAYGQVWSYPISK